ncbi:MAG TPA: Atu1372/SO_1960 family protein [Flavitalea sp.]|nr:Atu1372/SO_1960 family protein [Flavitalea sp.]
MIKRKVGLFLLLAIAYAPVALAQAKPNKILVFSKTSNGYYHTSIPEGVAAIQRLAKEMNFGVDATTDSAYFTEDSLKNYAAVVFMNTNGVLLDTFQKADFERYIQAGGGYLGVHSATASEYKWPWYGRLVGAYFNGHPDPQEAYVEVKEPRHPSTRHLPRRWKVFDEWYNFREISPDIRVLMSLDETTYKGGKNGAYHPIAWYHEFDGGRAFYTGLGHTKKSYSDPLFLNHLRGGLQYAIGKNKPLDYSKAKTSRIQKTNNSNMETTNAKEKLKALGLSLPPAPAPVGVYKPSLLVDGKYLYLSGHGPVQQDGTLIKGRVGQDLDMEQGKLAARQVGLALLATVDKSVGLDKVKRVIKVLGMVNSTDDFQKQPYVINGCSELFAAIWGDDNGIGVRSAVGFNVLPDNIPVEIEVIFELK